MTDEAREEKLKAANRILEIRYEMLGLLREANRLAKTHIESEDEYVYFDRYLFERIAESIEARNPYNKDFSDVRDAIIAEARLDS